MRKYKIQNHAVALFSVWMDQLIISLVSKICSGILTLKSALNSPRPHVTLQIAQKRQALTRRKLKTTSAPRDSRAFSRMSQTADVISVVQKMAAFTWNARLDWFGTRRPILVIGLLRKTPVVKCIHERKIESQIIRQWNISARTHERMIACHGHESMEKPKKKKDKKTKQEKRWKKKHLENCCSDYWSQITLCCIVVILFCIWPNAWNSGMVALHFLETMKPLLGGSVSSVQKDIAFENKSNI